MKKTLTLVIALISILFNTTTTFAAEKHEVKLGTYNGQPAWVHTYRSAPDWLKRLLGPGDRTWGKTRYDMINENVSVYGCTYFYNNKPEVFVEFRTTTHDSGNGNSGESSGPSGPDNSRGGN